MTDLGWPIIVIAILCAFGWRKHREKRGKKVSWYTDLLVAGGWPSLRTLLSDSRIASATINCAFVAAHKKNAGI
jgi:hypothetical protein